MSPGEAFVSDAECSKLVHHNFMLLTSRLQGEANATRNSAKSFLEPLDNKNEVFGPAVLTLMHNTREHNLPP